MKHKAFSKITVSELIRDCNVNRKTFYYHFQDIYDLLKWMLEQEAFEVVKHFDLNTNYKDALEFTIEYVEQNAFFLNCIYDSIGREELKRFICQDFIGIVEIFIRNTENTLHATIPDDFREFLCSFYTEGLAGMIINHFQNPDIFKKEQLTEYVSLMIEHSIPAAILHAPVGDRN